MHRKIFRGISIENFISIPSFFTHFDAFSNFRIGLPGGMKIQKSLCLHVWSLRMRSKHGMVTKLFSAQRYDPRQVSQNFVWCAEPHKKFSRRPQSHTVECVKHNFRGKMSNPVFLHLLRYPSVGTTELHNPFRLHELRQVLERSPLPLLDRRQSPQHSGVQPSAER